MTFLAPSFLDYSAYCTTRKREGIIGNYSLGAAMACLQEAKEWKKTGNYELVTSKNLIQNETDGYREFGNSRLSLKHAIHKYSFAILELAHIGFVVACGYEKDGVICCSPGDLSIGKHGKFTLKWSDFDSHLTRGWCVV